MADHHHQQIEPGSQADKMQDYIAEAIAANCDGADLTPAQYIARAIVVGSLAIDRIKTGQVWL